MYLAVSICFIVEEYFLLQAPWAHLVFTDLLQVKEQKHEEPS